MDQMNKTDINDISILYFAEKYQLNFSISYTYLDYDIIVMQDLLVTFYTYRNSY